MTSSCGRRSPNSAAAPADWARRGRPRSESAVGMFMWFSGQPEACCTEAATPPKGSAGVPRAISESLYAIVDSEQELPPVQLVADLLRLGALVSDGGRIEDVVY